MKKTIYLFVLILLTFGFLQPVLAQNDKMDIFIFTQKGCTYCAQAIELLNKLKNTDYPNIEIHEYDLVQNPKSYKKLVDFSNAYQISTQTVPLIFISDKAIDGFQETNIRSLIDYNYNNLENYQNPEDFVKENLNNNPNNPNNSNTESYVGWIVLVVLGIGVVAFVVYKVL